MNAPDKVVPISWIGSKVSKIDTFCHRTDAINGHEATLLPYSHLLTIAVEATVFNSHLTKKFVAISGVLLVLAASLPEVVCCCNISWGPGGLVGNTQPCKDDCGATKKGHPCCCATEKNAADQGLASAECSSTPCKCQFSLVSPKPMSGSDGVTFEAIAGLDYCITDPTDDSVKLSACLLAVPCNRSLTSGSLCALLQTWQA